MGSVAGPGSFAVLPSPFRGPRRPQPRQPAFSSWKPGRASGAGTSAPTKGEVEVERGAQSVAAAARASVPLPLSLPPLLPARLPPRPRARDSPQRGGRPVGAGEAQGSPTRRAANGKLEGEMQIPGERRRLRENDSGGQGGRWVGSRPAAWAAGAPEEGAQANGDLR